MGLSILTNMIPWWARILVVLALVGTVYGKGYVDGLRHERVIADAAMAKQMEAQHVAYEKALKAALSARDQAYQEQLRLASDLTAKAQATADADRARLAKTQDDLAAARKLVESEKALRECEGDDDMRALINGASK